MQPQLVKHLPRPHYIKDFCEGDHVSMVFLVIAKSNRETSKKKPYWDVKLGDKTGELSGKVWDPPADQDIRSNDFVMATGVVETYNDKLQLNIKQIQLVDPPLVMDDFLPASKFDRHEMYATLLAEVKAMQDPHLKEVLALIVDAADGTPFAALKPLIRDAPAAKKNHHAYLGGLLEHILSMIGSAKHLCDHYRELNMDLLVAGCILHDIGKIWELSFERSIQYTDKGQMVGHVPMGIALVQICIGRVKGFPPALGNHLLHLIASHHGAEHGVTAPQSREAIALHHVDHLDATLAAMNAAIESDSGPGSFTEAWPSMVGRPVLK